MPIMLSSSGMKYPGEKNFEIFISLLLEGTGAAIILFPSHLGMKEELFSAILLVLVGLSTFVTGLMIQAGSVWRPAPKIRFLILGLTLIHLLIVGCMLMYSGHIVGFTAMLASAGIQTLLLFPLGKRLKNIDFLMAAISAISMVTGILLSVTRADAPVMMPELAAVFLVTAFIGFVSVILPSFKYGFLLGKLQLIPWGVFIFLVVMPMGTDNLIIPSVIISMLLFGDLIPWDRLVVPEGDVLSRRVITIAFFGEIAHLIFLGALLFTIDPVFQSHRSSILSAREGTLAFFILFSAVTYYTAITVVMTTSGLILELNKTGEEADEVIASEIDSGRWSHRLEQYIKPFIMTAEGIRGRIQTNQVNTLTRQVATEKKRNSQLTLLLELSQQLENQLDQPVSAQLAVNTLERAANCGLALILAHEPEKKEFTVLASAGRYINLVPTGYRQDATTGILGRALRQRKTQIINDIRHEPDYISFKNENSLSAAVIPLISNGHIHGMITLTHEKPNAFSSLEIGIAETVAAELTRAWDRSGYHQRLKDLIQTGSRLTSAPDPETTAQDVASISRDIVQAKFTFIYIQLGQERNFIQHASSGKAPQLLASLMDQTTSSELINMTLRASQPFRIRDVRKYEKTAGLILDNTGLRSLLTIPIRWHHVNIGAIFAFGKQNEVFFTENDESLAELISIQAGGAFESTWLQQELRSSLRITSLLYRLSNQIIQSENIEDAAADIAQTAHKLGKNLVTGIVLFNEDDRVIAEVKVDDEGIHTNSNHPLSLIHDAMNSGQMIYFSPGESVLRTCLPIQTPIRAYGAIWMDNHDDPSRPAANPNDLQALVNQAAIALERSLLLVESRRQAKEIKAAYDTLEETYDQTLASLTSALDARDRETEGHSLRVTDLSVRLGESLGYSPEQLKILERGALLHDIGKIGISDTILHKPGPLTEDEWKIMRLHPDIGARIVAGIPFLEDTIPLIRHHQERWDGTGYPGRLKGEEIPELARLFATIDAFDALTSNRPYREKISKKEALAYLHEQAGILFDPKMVNALDALLQKKPELMLVTE